jgi:large subunit ribosomal protein L15
MQSHQLQRRTPNKAKVQVGRGSKRGKTAGRGTKGQKARAGHKLRPEIRDMIKKLPKLRGRGKNIFKSIKDKPTVVNLALLEIVFENGATVTPQILLEKGLVSKVHSRVPKVKILGTGEISKKITLSGCSVSASAAKKIEAAGGTHE